ncbi:MAG: hypothetical protein MUF30_01935 [Burkholderiales bacterium]|nr:hypothetical protein [Burkholderiales bacterium]
MNPSRRTAVLALLASVAVAAPVGAAAPNKIDMAKARALVLELPEVQAWQQARREAAAREAKGGLASGGILTGRRPIGGRDGWAVTFYEDPQVTAKKWNVFLVRASDGAVFVEAGEGRPPLTLERWRATAAARQ